MLDQLTQNDLRPGDVLLHRSRHWVSTLIRAFDGGEFSHASIYNGSHIVEMDAPGIVTKTVDQILANTSYVHVFRFRSNDGYQLGSRNCPYEPVLERIKYYANLQPRLAWGTFPILGALTLVRRAANESPVLCKMLDRIGAPVSNFVATRRNAITCTEFVYRCFAEAGDAYDLRIMGRGSIAPSGIAARAAHIEVLSALQRDNSSTDPMMDQYETEVAGRPRAEPTFVTAADFCKTPNLVRVGKLSRTFVRSSPACGT